MRKIKNTLKKPDTKITLSPVIANAGIRIDYEKKLRKIVEVMANSFEYWISAWYKKDPPPLALDASPVKEIMSNINVLGNDWIKRFNDFAKKMARSKINEIANQTDNTLKKSLDDVGFTVNFTMNSTQQNAVSASIEENVNLIKSIPQQYIKDVKQVITEGFSRGRDLSYIGKELRKRYGIADKRSKLIARDQCNKATAIFDRTRQLELGIQKNIWKHSRAGKEPRKSHVAANGKEYDIEKGCLIDGEYILPGQKINCRCYSTAVINWAEIAAVNKSKSS